MYKALILICALLMSMPCYAQAIRNKVNLENAVTGTLPVANGGTGCTGVAIISSGSSNTWDTNSCTIGWNSSSASVKSQAIAGCSSVYLGRRLSIKDIYGSSNLYSIVITPASGTCDGLSTCILSSPKGSITLQCDGVSNWMEIQ